MRPEMLMSEIASGASRKSTIRPTSFWPGGNWRPTSDEACRNAIRHAQSHQDWRYRRAWSLYNPDDRRLSGLSFENRVTLVLERGSREWKRTMQLYSVRNQIAHGTLLSERIDVSSEIQEFFHIRLSLARD